MLSVLRRRFTGDSSEDPVKMSQRLETHFKGNLADPVPRVQQEVLRFLQPDAGNKVGVVGARGLLESFAERIPAHADLFGDHGEGDVFQVLGRDQFPGAGDLRWFRVGLQQDDLVGQPAELLGKDLK